MGLFSKTKTYIESTTVPIHEEIPDTVKQSVLTSIVQDRSISDDLIANTLNSLGTKVKTFYRYGRDTYHHGLPEGTLNYTNAGPGTVQRVIEDIEQQDVVITFSVYTSADSTYFAYNHLVNTRGWDSDTNVVSVPPFTPTGEVTLESTEWLSNSSIRIHYLDDGSTSSTEDITIGITVEQGNYYHVGYLVGEEQKYFYYYGLDTTYEVLYVESNEKESVYFPVVPFISDNVDLSVDPGNDDPLFNTSKKLLRKIGIDFEDVGKSIQENPDIDEVDYAYLTITAPIQSEAVATQEYLFNYFKYLEQTQTFYKADFESWESIPLEDRVNPPSLNIVEVTETENDSAGTGKFHVEFGFHYIESEVKAGIVGEGTVGSIERETIVLDATKASNYEYENSYMLWRRQETSTTYTELKVAGLRHVNYVYGDRHIDSTLEGSLGDSKDDFNLPVNYTVLKNMNVLRQTDVLNDCIRLCFNSVLVQKLEWYETSIFKGLIIIVAAVITVLTQGAGGQAMSWAIAITGSTNIALQFAVAVLLVAAISVGVGFLVDFIGIQKIAILQAIYTVYQLYQGDFSGLTGEMLMQLQTGILQGFNFYINNESHDIMHEQDEIEAEQERQQAELDELIEAFPSSYLDPMTLLDFSTSLAGTYESPSQYYFTRIHSGNIGTLVFDEIEYFVDKNLQLEGVTNRNALDI